MKTVILLTIGTLGIGTLFSEAHNPELGRGARPRPQLGGIFGALDANRDARLDAFEISHSPDALRKLDRSGDGEVSREEVGLGDGGRRTMTSMGDRHQRPKAVGDSPDRPNRYVHRGGGSEAQYPPAPSRFQPQAPRELWDFAGRGYGSLRVEGDRRLPEELRGLRRGPGDGPRGIDENERRDRSQRGDRLPQPNFQRDREEMPRDSAPGYNEPRQFSRRPEADRLSPDGRERRGPADRAPRFDERRDDFQPRRGQPGPTPRVPLPRLDRDPLPIDRSAHVL